jgi:hypothetical protein
MCYNPFLALASLKVASILVYPPLVSSNIVFLGPVWAAFSQLALSFTTDLVVEFLIKIYSGGCVFHSYDVTHPPCSSKCNIKSSTGTFFFMLLYTTYIRHFRFAGSFLFTAE